MTRAKVLLLGLIAYTIYLGIAWGIAWLIGQDLDQVLPYFVLSVLCSMEAANILKAKL